MTMFSLPTVIKYTMSYSHVAQPLEKDILSHLPTHTQMLICLWIQATLSIGGFYIHGFNQLWIKNIQEKNPRKFQKVKLEFATC